MKAFTKEFLQNLQSNRFTEKDYPFFLQLFFTPDSPANADFKNFLMDNEKKV